MQVAAFVQAQYDSQIPREAQLAAERADQAARDARPARIRRMANIAEQADLAAIRSRDPDVLANKILTYWDYVEAARLSYPYPKVISDYLVVLHEPLELRSRDIRKLPPQSRVRKCREYVRARFHEERRERQAKRAYRRADDALAVAAE